MTRDGVTIVGLGPAGWDRIPESTRGLLLDEDVTVVLRTIRHPAAETLAERRSVTTCDDLYEAADSYPDVYRAIAVRVSGLEGPVVYAVPGSPLVGEFAVAEIRRAAGKTGRPVEVIPAESFLDAVLAAVGVDPLADGFQLLNGHELPAPLVVDKPTVIGHLDRPMVLSDVCTVLDRVLPEEATVTLVVGAGGPEQRLVEAAPLDLDPGLAGNLTSMYVAPMPGGLIGAVHAMRRLRIECPWDRQQTHRSLVRYLLEESHELADAIAALPVDAGGRSGDEEVGPEDWGAYADVEEELGDVLLQVLFHAAIATETGVFDIDDVGEQLRRKLVRRHPHVFGDVTADDADTVKANWDAIKREEKPAVASDSRLDGVPSGIPAMARAAEIQRRAAAVGFDWSEPGPVFEKVREELAELAAESEPEGRGRELGDLLFSVVNLSRHLAVEPETALRAAIHRFEERFRAMERIGSLDGLTLEELDALWEAVKAHPTGEFG